MHYYCGFGWDAARIGGTLDRAADWSRQHGVRLLAGEFGASVQLNAAARLGLAKYGALGFPGARSRLGIVGL